MHIEGVIKDYIKNKKLERKYTKRHPKSRRLQKYLIQKKIDNRLLKGESIHINKLKPPPTY